MFSKLFKKLLQCLTLFQIRRGNHRFWWQKRDNKFLKCYTINTITDITLSIFRFYKWYFIWTLCSDLPVSSFKLLLWWKNVQYSFKFFKGSKILIKTCWRLTQRVVTCCIFCGHSLVTYRLNIWKNYEDLCLTEWSQILTWSI